MLSRGATLPKEDLPNIIFQSSASRNGDLHSTFEQIEQEHIRCVLALAPTLEDTAGDPRYPHRNAVAQAQTVSFRLNSSLGSAPKAGMLNFIGEWWRKLGCWHVAYQSDGRLSQREPQREQKACDCRQHNQRSALMDRFRNHRVCDHGKHRASRDRLRENRHVSSGSDEYLACG